MKTATDNTLTRVACLSASALSFFLASCASNKNTGYIAPPAATAPLEAPALALDATMEPAELAAAPPEPFSLREGEKLVKYRIKKGDSLEKIGKAFGTTPSRIRSANEMDSDMIYYGRSLKVPTTKEVVAAQAPAEATPVAPIAPVAPVAPAPAAPAQPAPIVVPTPRPTPPVPAPAPSPAPAPVAPQLQLTPPQAIAPPVPQPTPAPAPTGITTGPAPGGFQFSD